MLRPRVISQTARREARMSNGPMVTSSGQKSASSNKTEVRIVSHVHKQIFGISDTALRLRVHQIHAFHSEQISPSL